MGLEFAETMAGSFELLSEGSRARPMSFTLRARTPSLFRFLRHPVAEIEGEIDAEGFADHRHLRGTLGLDVLRTGHLDYAFTFDGNDGAPYAFAGKKTVIASEPIESMTVLPGLILRASGEELGRALLRFDLQRDLVRFLRSFRPTD